MPFTKNIKTDYGAVGNGQVAVTNCSITAGTNALAVSTAIFVAGDVGKAIIVLGAAGAIGNQQALVTSISTFVDSQHITLAANAAVTITALSQRLYWGTDDSTAFTNWRTDARAQGTNPCVLNIPAGIYCNFTRGDFWTGVFDCTVNVDGATLAQFSTGGALLNDPGNVARLHQVNAGDTVLSLVTPSQTSFFTVNNWVCLSSLELQGGGYPPNWIYFEYHKITAIGTGTITIDTPAKYTHLATYPATNPGGSDSGGPASLFNLTQTWNQTVFVDGGVGGGILDGSGQVQLIARSITIHNCEIGPQNGIDPSNSITITLNNCTLDGGVEVDKDLTLLTLNNCTNSTVGGMFWQSASVDTIINGGTYASLTGSGRNMTMNGVTVTGQMMIGGIAYGENLSFNASNCSFGSIVSSNQTLRFDLATAGLSYANGVFSAPNGSASIGAFYAAGVPGSVMYWEGQGAIGGPPNWGHPSIITAIWSDAVNTYMSISPPLPSMPAYRMDPDEPVETVSGPPWLVAHSAPRATFSNCTGCADAIDFSQAEPGQPLWSYTKRTYASDAIGAGGVPFTRLWGKVSYIKINVTAAAVGVGPLNLNMGFLIDANDIWHRNDLVIQIDLSHTGMRTITPTQVTGAVGADVISFTEGGWPKEAWLTNGIGPNVSPGTVTGGSVTIEMATDQSVPPPKTLFRPRFRLQ